MLPTWIPHLYHFAKTHEHRSDSFLVLRGRPTDGHFSQVVQEVEIAMSNDMIFILILRQKKHVPRCKINKY